MYCDHFCLREKPFNMTPDPRFLFLSEGHRDALAHLAYGIDNRTGFIALTGEIGAGKTTVLRALLTQLDPDRYCTALIFNPCLSAPDLLRAVNREFLLPSEGLESPALLEALNRFLIRQHEKGKIVVLVIDEAQNLRPEVLEQIRLISNLETDREKLLQIVLSGQPEMVQLLERKELRQLNQRIVVRYHLRPMTPHDTSLYILHRMKVAGAKGTPSFTKGSVQRIYRYSGGLPRLVNIAADRSLLAAYTRNAQTVTARIASVGIADVKSERASRRWKVLAGAGLATAMLAAAAGIHFYGQELLEHFRPPAPAAAAQPVTATVPTPEPPPKKLEAAWRGSSEEASARAAFNALAGAWNINPIDGPADLSDPRTMERAVREAGLSLCRFSGNLGGLLRLDSPAILEMRLPGLPDRRYAALTGTREGQLRMDVFPGETATITALDLEQCWTGRALVAWKNPLGFPDRLLPGSSGKNVRDLQRLLAQAGAYAGQVTGRYDRQTVSAVREFQSGRGLEPDGIAGQQTLILLYRAADRAGSPGLER